MSKSHITDSNYHLNDNEEDSDQALPPWEMTPERTSPWEKGSDTGSADGTLGKGVRPCGSAAYVIRDKRIVRALVYMQLGIEVTPSLAELARFAHMPPFHFHRLFSKLVGVTPKHYQLQLQMHIAKEMLRTTRKAISNIAEETGFSSHGHFTSTFQWLFGQTPLEYRHPRPRK